MNLAVSGFYVAGRGKSSARLKTQNGRLSLGALSTISRPASVAEVRVEASVVYCAATPTRLLDFCPEIVLTSN
jgi:hypothetical protein